MYAKKSQINCYRPDGCASILNRKWRKEEIKMNIDVWSVISIILVVVGFFGGIWYEHK